MTTRDDDEHPTVAVPYESMRDLVHGARIPAVRHLTAVARKQQLRKVASFEVARLAANVKKGKRLMVLKLVGGRK